MSKVAKELLRLALAKLEAIHKGYPIFWPILDLLTYSYPILGPIFEPIYLSLCIHIQFLRTYLLTGAWDILYGRPLGSRFQELIFNL